MILSCLAFLSTHSHRVAIHKSHWQVSHITKPSSSKMPDLFLPEEPSHALSNTSLDDTTWLPYVSCLAQTVSPLLQISWLVSTHIRHNMDSLNHCLWNVGDHISNGKIHTMRESLASNDNLLVFTQSLDQLPVQLRSWIILHGNLCSQRWIVFPEGIVVLDDKVNGQIMLWFPFCNAFIEGS